MGITVVLLAGIYLFLFKTNIGLQCRTVIPIGRWHRRWGSTPILRLIYLCAGRSCRRCRRGYDERTDKVNPEMGLSFLSRSFFVVILEDWGTYLALWEVPELLVAMRHSFLISFLRHRPGHRTSARNRVIRLKPKGLFGGAIMARNEHEKRRINLIINAIAVLFSFAFTLDRKFLPRKSSLPRS